MRCWLRPPLQFVGNLYWEKQLQVFPLISRGWEWFHNLDFLYHRQNVPRRQIFCTKHSQIYDHGQPYFRLCRERGGKICCKHSLAWPWYCSASTILSWLLLLKPPRSTSKQHIWLSQILIRRNHLQTFGTCFVEEEIHMFAGSFHNGFRGGCYSWNTTLVTPLNRWWLKAQGSCKSKTGLQNLWMITTKIIRAGSPLEKTSQLMTPNRHIFTFSLSKYPFLVCCTKIVTTSWMECELLMKRQNQLCKSPQDLWLLLLMALNLKVIWTPSTKE